VFSLRRLDCYGKGVYLQNIQYLIKIGIIKKLIFEIHNFILISGLIYVPLCYFILFFKIGSYKICNFYKEM